MDVTLFGITTVANCVQPVKAVSLIVVSVDGKLTLFKAVLPAKQPSPRVVTPSGTENVPLTAGLEKSSVLVSFE